MYLSLNFEYIYPKNIVKKRKSDKNFIYFCAVETQRKKDLRKQIVKSAERYAYKFVNESSRYDDAIFLHYSSKFLKKIVKTESQNNSVDSG